MERLLEFLGAPSSSGGAAQFSPARNRWITRQSGRVQEGRQSVNLAKSRSE